MDENCLVIIKLLSQHYAIENSREIQEEPTVMGKPVGIVRKIIYNNHRTKYRLVRKKRRRRRRRRNIQKPLYLENRSSQRTV